MGQLTELYCWNCGGGNPPESLRCMWCGAAYPRQRANSEPVGKVPANRSPTPQKRRFTLSAWHVVAGWAAFVILVIAGTWWLTQSETPQLARYDKPGSPIYNLDYS